MKENYTTILITNQKLRKNNFIYQKAFLSKGFSYYYDYFFETKIFAKNKKGNATILLILGLVRKNAGNSLNKNFINKLNLFVIFLLSKGYLRKSHIKENII